MYNRMETRDIIAGMVNFFYQYRFKLFVNDIERSEDIKKFKKQLQWNAISNSISREFKFNAIMIPLKWNAISSIR